MFIGFISVMLLIVILASTSFFALDKSISNIKTVVENNDRHVYKLNKMHTAARERILTLHKMVATEDPFLRDELWMNFNRYGTEFIANRNDLVHTQINDSILKLLQQQDEYTQPLGRLQYQIAELSLEGQINQARDLLLQDANPLQVKMLEFFREIGSIVEQDAQLAIKEASDLNRYAKLLVFIISSLIVIVSYFITQYIFKRVSQSESQLQEEKQRALITLHSIADAVLLVDNQGRIEGVNEVAEKLLGQDETTLVGQYLNEAIKLYNEDDPSKSISLIPDDSSVIKACKSLGWSFLHNASQEQLAVEYSVSPIIFRDELKGIIVVIHDISSIQKLTKNLAYEANHDSLTGLKNRRNFESKLKEVINEVKRYEENTSWLCYFDLDHFKEVNDVAGHLAGDELLKQIADIILSAVRNTDYVARLGGDEFSAILRYADKEEALIITERIRQTIEELVFFWDGNEFNITSSLGLVRIDKKYNKIDELLHQADKACYYSKKHGRNQIHSIEN